MPGPSFYLKQLELGPMQNFVYLIGDPATREAAVVDPGWEVPRILAEAAQDGYQLTRAFVTHAHFDHVMGLGELLKAVTLPVHVHQADAAQLDLEPAALQLTMGDEIIAVGQLPVKVLHTPGHTPGSQCFFVDGWLFTGDTLFVNACGRWDLPGGDPATLYASLMKLKALDDETIVCPGHHYAHAPVSRMGQEKRQNPFLQSPTLEHFLHSIGDS